MKHVKLEHKTENVLPLTAFLFRMFNYTLFAFGLIAFSLGIGVAGYSILGGLSILDAFHMSSMILTGMGPVAEMKSDAAKIFSSFYALYSGIAFLSITAVFLTPVVHRLLHILHIEQ